MNKLIDTFNGLALKLGRAIGAKLAALGANTKLVKLLLVLLVLPIGPLLLGLFLLGRKVRAAGQKVWNWLVVETVLVVLVLACGLFLGVIGWAVYDHLQERHISIAAGARTSESYKLAQALKLVMARHYPRIRLAILEIEEAAGGNNGMLEKDIVQLAAIPSGLPAGSSALSVALLASAQPRILFARSDVDKRVVYALTEVLTQFSGELTAVIPVGKAAPQPLTTSIQRPVVKAPSDAPLHPGAAAFYDRDKTLLVVRYAKLLMFVLVGLILLGLWTWELRRRTRPAPIVQPVSFVPPVEREPWTFAKILLENVGEATVPLPMTDVMPPKN